MHTHNTQNCLESKWQWLLPRDSTRRERQCTDQPICRTYNFARDYLERHVQTGSETTRWSGEEISDWQHGVLYWRSFPPELFSGPNAKYVRQTLLSVAYWFLLEAIGQILSDIMRTAGDMSGNTFDANSVINIASTLIQHNKAQCRVSDISVLLFVLLRLIVKQDFLVYTETLLRIALARFEVSVPSLTRLLQVSMSLYRRTTIKIVTEDKTPVISSLVLVVSELLSETLRGKSRVTSCSLTSMIQVSIGNQKRSINY